MDARTGLGILLSLLLVVVVAVALRRPERPTTVALATSRPTEAPKVVAKAPAPAKDIASASAFVAGASRARVRQISATNGRRAPRSAFTTVGEGERLGDVALRVYGSLEAKSLLWAANRDQVADPDETLRTGLALRTP
jgi:hypothetical protein